MNRVCEAAVGWVLLIRRLVGRSEAEHVSGICLLCFNCAFVSGAVYVRPKSK